MPAWRPSNRIDGGATTNPPAAFTSTARPSDCRRVVHCSPLLRYQRCTPPLGVSTTSGVHPQRDNIASPSAASSMSTTVTRDNPHKTPMFCARAGASASSGTLGLAGASTVPRRPGAPYPLRRLQESLPGRAGTCRSPRHRTGQRRSRCCPRGASGGVLHRAPSNRLHQVIRQPGERAPEHRAGYEGT